MKLTQRQIQHLYFRAGFGERYSRITKAHGKTAQALVEEIFTDAERIEQINVFEPNTNLAGQLKMLSDEAKKALLKDAIDDKMDLNILWLQQMVSSKAFLREKMTLFWHDHFASESKNPYFTQIQNNLIRKNALGSFRDLLFAVSKDQVMLKYLNNQQNRKQQPNENFAREVMELFTIGRGNYTENDIKEAARAFTGWGFNKEGHFIFRSRQHDYGEKTIFGKTGRFDGKDVLNILLEKKETAIYIVRKIYKYFVNQTENEQIIQQLASEFFSSDYDITKLMKRIFTTEWFYKEENIGKRIKSPVEFLVNLQKTFGIQFQDRLASIFIQRALGQILFKPPNVAGWPDGKAWIDSTTLMFRVKFPEIIFKSYEFALASKESGDAFDSLKDLKRFQKIQAEIDWQGFIAQFAGEKDIDQALRNYLIQSNSKLDFVKSSQADKLERVKEMIFNLTRLPDFQLC